jgi:hypothetical protein
MKLFGRNVGVLMVVYRAPGWSSGYWSITLRQPRVQPDYPWMQNLLALVFVISLNA